MRFLCDEKPGKLTFWSRKYRFRPFKLLIKSKAREE